MYPRALHFMLAASWLYVAFVLARVDRRWFAGRIVECLVLAAFPALCFWRNWLGTELLLAAGAAFGLFGIWPPALERKAMGDIMVAGRVGRRWVLRALRLLSWDRTARALAALERFAGAVGWDTSVESEQLAAIFAGKSSAQVRNRYLTALLLQLSRKRAWSEGIAICRRLLPEAAQKATPELLLLLARCHAELGESDRAAELFAAACTHPQAADYEGERLLAGTALFAMMGERAALEQLLERHQAFLAGLPRPFAPYWRAVAALRAGDAAQAQELFARALELARGSFEPAEAEVWQQAVAQRLAQGSSGAAVSAAEVERLQALDQAASRVEGGRLAGVRVFGRGIGRLTAVILAANVLVWLVLELRGPSTDMNALVTFGANVPALVWHDGQYWRLVSSMFIHIGLLHLAFNGYACYLFGTFLERWCRSRQMFLIYMLSGLCASGASALLGRYSASAGASGAIMGLLGAAIVVILRFRRTFPAAVRSLYAMNFILMAVLTLVFGMVQEGIDNYAHAGGLFTGALVGLFLRSCPREAEGDERRTLRASLLNAAVVVLAGVVLYAAVMAAKNVAAGGYPAVLPRMEEREYPREGFAVTVPRLWLEEHDDEGRLVFGDPVLGALVLMRSAPLPADVPVAEVLRRAAEARWRQALAAGDVAKRALAAPAPLKLDGMMVYHFRYGSVPASGGRLDRGIALPPGPIVTDVYVAAPAAEDGGGAPLCLLEFHVPRAGAERYQPLERLVVGSLRARAAASSPRS